MNLSATSWSLKFKQLDRDKFILGCNFYNLEDNVGLDGVGIGTSKDMVQWTRETQYDLTTYKKWNDYVAI